MVKKGCYVKFNNYIISSFFLLLSVFILQGCVSSNNPIYIVSRDVPENPSFTVIPFNNYQLQISCTDSVESALISSGVKVVKRPEVKEVENRKGYGGEQKQIDQPNENINSKGAFETRIERYSEYEEIKSDYIIETNCTVQSYQGSLYIEGMNVRITKTISKEILASFQSNLNDIKNDMNEALRTLGIKVYTLTNTTRN
jgi:hypothetical protein